MDGLPTGGAVHFVGIGGAGMSGLAEAALRAGYRVTGCDASEGDTVEHLRGLGAEVFIGHSAEHAEDADALVVTSAVPTDHPELEAAARRGIPVVKRAAALGAWVRRGRTIGVAGTHGKTTTTAMTAEILTAAGLDPTAFVGGTVASWDSNVRVGSDTWFVVEADEFDRSFLSLDPDVAIVTNVEADHLDIYGDPSGVDRAFEAYLERVRADGSVVACADDAGASRLIQSIRTDTVTYGLNAGSMLRAVDLRADRGTSRFSVWERGEDRGPLAVAAPGVHNVRNALGAAAAARTLGLSWASIRDGLARFRGVRRRFQTVGSAQDVVVVDDYAHHPTEVRATLDAARRAFPEQRIVAVFQPHLYSRTRDFHAEFGRALALADVVWVTGIYPAREAPIPGVTGDLVAEAARGAGAVTHYHEPLDDLAEVVGGHLDAGDLCLTMGAGSIERVGGELIEVLKKRGEVGS